LLAADQYWAQAAVDINGFAVALLEYVVAGPVVKDIEFGSQPVAFKAIAQVQVVLHTRDAIISRRRLLVLHRPTSKVFAVKQRL